MYLSSFPNTIYWRDCLFLIVYSCLLCHRLIDHICAGLFLGSVFCSIDLCICFWASNHTVLITMALYYSLKLGVWYLLFFFKKIYCCSSTVVSIFTPPRAPWLIHPHLPPLNLPPLSLSMWPSYLFLDGPSCIIRHYPSPPSSLVTVSLFFILMSLVVFVFLSPYLAIGVICVC